MKKLCAIPLEAGPWSFSLTAGLVSPLRVGLRSWLYQKASGRRTPFRWGGRWRIFGLEVAADVFNLLQVHQMIQLVLPLQSAEAESEAQIEALRQEIKTINGQGGDASTLNEQLAQEEAWLSELREELGTRGAGHVLHQ